ncbi:MAG: hypothetical protein HY673_26450 [Chloroflexi bacterium]|nr:hypothetical protein [Chloroflexota bacterium]
MAAIRRAMKWQEPADTITARDWLAQFTRDERILGIFQSLTAAMQTINLHEQPAGSFVRFLKWSSQARGFGHPPGGFLALMESLAGVIKAKGGDVWTGCAARKILVDRWTARGIVVAQGREEIAVEANVVVSDAGPGPTVDLAGRENFDKSYLVQLQESVRPIPLVWISISSDRPLMEGAGPFFVTGAPRVNALYSPTAICPEVAPPGKHLVQSGGAPPSSSAPFNAREEIALNLQDLKEILPGLDRHGEVLLAQTFSGGWPACRTWPGYEMPVMTPVENLYNVGDGVCPPGMSGSAGSAQSARLVVADIKKRFPRGS